MGKTIENVAKERGHTIDAVIDADFTAEEIIEKEEKIVNAGIKRTAFLNKKIAKENNKASGNTKLLDLGLTQAEATALTGYTPE